MGGVNAMLSNLLTRYKILAVKRGLTLGALKDASPAEFRLLVCSATLAVPRDQNFSEREFNEILRNWLASAGAMLAIDHVELRRWLVDLGLVVRDRAGSRYSRGELTPAYTATARELAGIDLGQAATDAIEDDKTQRAQRKARWLDQRKNGDAQAQ